MNSGVAIHEKAKKLQTAHEPTTVNILFSLYKVLTLYLIYYTKPYLFIINQTK